MCLLRGLDEQIVADLNIHDPAVLRAREQLEETNDMANKTKRNQKLERWIDARRRHHLSHAQVQMARELGMNPMKLGQLDNHDQEPWKMPLREYIEHLYLKYFGKPSPDEVTSVEELWRLRQQKKEMRRPAGQKPVLGPS